MRKWLLPLALFVILVILTNHVIFKELEKEQDFYKDKLGKEFVLDKDTLKIVDYNSFESVFILSDGRKINKNLVK